MTAILYRGPGIRVRGDIELSRRSRRDLSRILAGEAVDRRWSMRLRYSMPARGMLRAELWLPSPVGTVHLASDVELAALRPMLARLGVEVAGGGEESGFNLGRALRSVARSKALRGALSVARAVSASPLGALLPPGTRQVLDLAQRGVRAVDGSRRGRPGAAREAAPILEAARQGDPHATRAARIVTLCIPAELRER